MFYELFDGILLPRENITAYERTIRLDKHSSAKGGSKRRISKSPVESEKKRKLDSTSMEESASHSNEHGDLSCSSLQASGKVKICVGDSSNLERENKGDDSRWYPASSCLSQQKSCKMKTVSWDFEAINFPDISQVADKVIELSPPLAELLPDGVRCDMTSKFHLNRVAQRSQDSTKDDLQFSASAFELSKPRHVKNWREWRELEPSTNALLDVLQSSITKPLIDHSGILDLGTLIFNVDGKLEITQILGIIYWLERVASTCIHVCNKQKNCGLFSC